VIYLRSDLSNLDAVSEPQGNPGGDPGYGVWGQTWSEDELVETYHVDPRELLDCVGLIRIPLGNGTSKIGTGTILARGANHYVLTAMHVVKGFHPSQIEFYVPRGQSELASAMGEGEPFRVVDGIDIPDLRDKDLALLKLDRPVTNVQGARLWRDSLTPSEVWMVGFGKDNYEILSDTVLASRTREFGRSRFDQKKEYNGEVSFKGWGPVYGEHLVYELGAGEAAIGAGDSGGPSLVWKRELTVNRHGKLVRGLTPYIVGVHVAADPPEPLYIDHESYDLSIAPMWESIDQRIPRRNLAFVGFDDLNIIESGDNENTPAGSGEWHFRMQANGQWQDSTILDAFSGCTYELGYQLMVDVTNANSLDIRFWGYEDDDGIPIFFGGTGPDDTIPLFQRTFGSLSYGGEAFTPTVHRLDSGAVYGEDCSYELTYWIVSMVI
ncbi:MAG: trypsin-like serine protease, partial [Planctomycetes bacterium]|nr:trypsin-like serine protease [Planctomycetota bacterium]